MLPVNSDRIGKKLGIEGIFEDKIIILPFKKWFLNRDWNYRNGVDKETKYNVHGSRDAQAPNVIYLFS